MDAVQVTELHWADEPIGEVEFPSKKLVLHHGIGSGLSHDPREPGIVWAVADRGPNVELDTAVEEYGWAAPPEISDNPDTKIMARPDLGPYLARLQITDTSVELIETVRLTSASGDPVPGTPIPERAAHQCEPAYSLKGEPVDPDPGGMDTEGLVALKDGSFWISEEYGPSLVRADRSGTVLRRLVPKDSALADTPGAEGSLPDLAARRHLNRGFEAVTATPSQERLFLAFQSPLAHPDKEAFKKSRHVRIWELDPDGQVLAQFLYPFDEPQTFRRDSAKRKLSWKDLKVCELAAVGERAVLVLERCLETCKIYRVELDPALATPAEHLSAATRPSIEELSRSEAPFSLPVLSKTLLFSSDDHPEVAADMEGLTFLSDRSLLIVSDNDFGVQDKRTRFFRLDCQTPFMG